MSTPPTTHANTDSYTDFDLERDLRYITCVTVIAHDSRLSPLDSKQSLSKTKRVNEHGKLLNRFNHRAFIYIKLLLLTYILQILFVNNVNTVQNTLNRAISTGYTVLSSYTGISDTNFKTKCLTSIKYNSNNSTRSMLNL